MSERKMATACINLRHADYWIDLATRYGGDEYIHAAINHLSQAVQLLGYRLVPITTPQQEHDALLAARVAEDGPPPVTSAPGFDGPDSSIGMREQDIEGTAV